MHPYKPEIKEIVGMIYKEQSPNQILNVRSKLYDLLVNCVEGSTILKELILLMIESKRFSEDNMYYLIHKATEI